MRLACGEIDMPIRIGRIPKTIAHLYQSDGRWLYLSRPTLLKQLSHHPEILPGFYEELDWLFASCEHIPNRRANCFHLVSNGAEHRWKVTIKVIPSNQRLLTLSIHELRDRDYNRLIKRAKK